MRTLPACACFIDSRRPTCWTRWWPISGGAAAVASAEELRLQPRAPLELVLALEELDLLVRLGDHETAVLDDLEVGAELGLELAPRPLSLEAERDRDGKLLRDRIPVLDHAVL